MNRSVSLLEVMAWSLWAAGVLAIVYDLALALHALGHFGVVLCCAGATLHVRGFILRLEERDLNAFELGRDSVRRINT